MSGFNRRFSAFPGKEVIREIEGVVVIDSAPPSGDSTVSAGVAALVGEFADVTYAVAIDSNGVITTRPQPTEIYSGQDLITKCGGFDSTIGEFGGDGGNGWLEAKNKSFSRLIVVPVNIASSQGGRVWRQLPTNKSSTEPTPVVPITGAVVPAGTEFKSAANRVRLAQRVVFSEQAEFASGVDGAITNAGSAAAFQTFSSAGGLFTTVQRPDGTQGVQPGDILVLGVIDGAGALGANANTYRVRTVTSATALTVEKLDGSTFDWTTGTNQPWRIHVYNCADTGAAAVATQGGYRVPMRPLDATIAINTNLTPTVVPTALTANSADALSGLGARSATVTGLVYTANVQAPNAGSTAELGALYVTAIDALKADDAPSNEVAIVWAARFSGVIDQKLVAHVLEVKATGRGRMCISAPALDTTAIATVLGNSAGGAGYARAREAQFTWPGFQTYVKEAVGIPIKGADGLLYTDGMIDTPATGWLAAIESQLPPERNPGQSSDPVKTIMANTVGMQRGLPVGMGVNEYKQLKAKGVIAGRNDRRVGRVFQSGVTRSLKPGETQINVRRFSFFVQDTLTDLLQDYTKELLSEQLKDAIVGVHDDFFSDLRSANNPTAQRIAGFEIDPRSGNTPELEDAGIFVVIHRVEMLNTLDNLVLQSEVGYGILRISELQAA